VVAKVHEDGQDPSDQLEVVVDRFSLALQAAETDDEGSYMMFEIGGFERLMDARWVATSYSGSAA